MASVAAPLHPGGSTADGICHLRAPAPTHEEPGISRLFRRGTRPVRMMVLFPFRGPLKINCVSLRVFKPGISLTPVPICEGLGDLHSLLPDSTECAFNVSAGQAEGDPKRSLLRRLEHEHCGSRIKPAHPPFVVEDFPELEDLFVEARHLLHVRDRELDLVEPADSCHQPPPGSSLRSLEANSRFPSAKSCGPRTGGLDWIGQPPPERQVPGSNPGPSVRTPTRGG